MRVFLRMLNQMYLQDAVSFDSSHNEPSLNSTLVRTKAPPPLKSMSARFQERVFATLSLIHLFQANSRMGRLRSKS